MRKQQAHCTRAALPLPSQRATHRRIARVALGRRHALGAAGHPPRGRRGLAAQQLIRRRSYCRCLARLSFQQQPADAAAGRKRAPQLRLERQAAAEVAQAQLLQQPAAQQRRAATWAATGRRAPGVKYACACVGS